MSAIEIRERNRSYTTKGPGVMPYRKTPGRPRLARATGPGSIGIDQEIVALIDADDEKAAAELFEAHKARTHKSGAWRSSNLIEWHFYYRRENPL